jgi:hypothetical protein
MKYSKLIKPINYLKSHTAEKVKDLRENQLPLLITQNDEAKLASMDMKSYEELEEAIVLSKILALGSREIEQGKYQEAEDVFAKLDQD